MSVNCRPSSCWGTAAYQPLPQLRPSPPRSASLDRDSERLSLPDEHHQALAARHSRVNQIPLQHRVVLRRQRDDHSRVFRTLTLVDRRCVSKYQLIQLAKAVTDVAPVEIDAELAFLYVDAEDDTEIAVVDFPIVVVFEASLAATSPEA
jgi:hypothetical protein